MKGMIKLGIVMALYATVACVGLALVYSVTEKTIEERTKADQNAALRELFPNADSFEDISGAFASGDPQTTFQSIFRAAKGSDTLGVAIQSARPSYGGLITLLTGVDTGGTVTRVKILEHSDTPGLGANAGLDSYFVDRSAGITFYGQFSGKTVTDAFEVNGDVTAITAATITSRAVTEAVKQSAAAGTKYLAGRR
ncbi:electron transport complex subunit G [Spirochaetia bacterium]|nr:electron transport complex subunit G [Spirochaetia bacterium]